MVQNEVPEYDPIPEGWKPHLDWGKEPCGLPDLNDAMGDWCYDTHMEIAWDQWARVRIFCVHGTAEGVSGGLCLNEAFHQAIKSRDAMDHSAKFCSAEVDPPEHWKVHEFWQTNTTECELFADHEGDHKPFEDEDEDDLYTYRYEHLQYFKNGHNRTGTKVFGSTEIPHPYLKHKKAWDKKGQIPRLEAVKSE